MGCYPPLAKFVSKVLRKCKGRERWRERRLDMDYAMAYPPMQTHYMQPVARTVTFASNNNVYVIPPQKTPPPPQQEQKQSTPEPPQQQQRETPLQQAEPDQHDAPPPQPDQPEQPPKPEQEEEKAPDAAPLAEPKPKPPKGPKRGKNKKAGGRVRFGPEPPPSQEQEQEEQHQHDAPDPGNGPGQGQHDHGPKGLGPAHQVPAYLLRYTPSPLPRWEATPRRHEYFSGEYRSYYPTPVREGIYRIATDANRLTTIFSEENPNACAIV
ncbi:hypothetical protein QOZ80_2AG0143130 [Eleusine coracana subsp. coracana]|nr:hypothetical protein QOZ80_2AG0143130 [Eleusine coracana subsp. coracana]